MKKILLAVCIMVFTAVPAFSQVATLTSPETLAVPTATKIDLRNINIDVTNKTVTVTYRFIDSTDKPIPAPESVHSFRTWQCRDIPAVPAFDPLTCTDVDVPNPCCTGAGTGEGCFEGTAAVTCFTDTFSFNIRSQDVGTAIGKGLRQLIWSKMRPSVLTGTNNATFE